MNRGMAMISKSRASALENLPYFISHDNQIWDSFCTSEVALVVTIVNISAAAGKGHKRQQWLNFLAPAQFLFARQSLVRIAPSLIGH